MVILCRDLFSHLVGYKSGKNIASKRATCNMPSSTNGEHEAVLTSLSRGPRENSEQSLHGHGLREPWSNRSPSTGINDFSHLFEPGRHFLLIIFALSGIFVDAVNSSLNCLEKQYFLGKEMR